MPVPVTQPSVTSSAPDVRRESYERRRTGLRSWLVGRGLHSALEAMAYAQALHSGVRRDGVTPEFDHQIAVVSYLTTLHPHLRHPEDTYCVGFLHDTLEDHAVSTDELDRRCGPRVAAAAWAMTKTHRGAVRDPDEVADAQAKDVIASITKGADRMHNQGTMTGVFSPGKIRAYTVETRTYIMPMLKRARALHPDQDGAYQNVRAVLRTQLELAEFLSAQTPN